MSDYTDLSRYLDAVGYTTAPNSRFHPPLQPGHDRLGPDIFVGYVSADAGVVAARTNTTITRTFSSEMYDLTDSGVNVRILQPGIYYIEFELSCVGSHSLEIRESQLGPTVIADSPPTVASGTGRTRLTGVYENSSIVATAIGCAEINFNILTQATSNTIDAEGSFIMIRRLGERVAT